MPFILLSSVFICALPILAQKPALNDDSVLKLVKAGLGDDLIVQTINSEPGRFDTSVDQLASLKQAGVSDRVLGAMLGRGMVSTEPVSDSVGASAHIDGVDEIGVYYQTQDGKWQAFGPEIINFKSGGVLKSIATDGIVKGDKNGHLPGQSSSLVLTRGTKILLYVMDGVSPEEYQLLKLRVNRKNREFRSETGGVFHSSSGANRDQISFKTGRVALRTYEFTLAPDLQPGEYGILPPGSYTSSNAASAGKMFTFKLLE